MLYRFAVFALLACWLSAARAACPDAPFDDPAQFRLSSDAALIVVHASSTYDSRVATKRGVDEAVAFARQRNIPVIYLQDDSPAKYYFASECRPDHRLYSQGGEIRFDLSGVTRLYVVGGHLELCLSAALHDILLQWARTLPKDRRVTFFMDGIYSNGKLIERSDHYYGDFLRFMDIVTYGRPGGEHWPKLTLLETMGIIVRTEHEFEYARKVLPRWDTTFSAAWRVEMRMNGSRPDVLREGEAGGSLLSFNYVDSAELMSSPDCYISTTPAALCMP